MPFRKNFYIIFSKGQILRIFRLKICPNFRCAGVRIPDNRRKHPLASICFQDEFFDKKSPDSLWNLGLSDLHLLRSEKVARVRVTPFRSVIRMLFPDGRGGACSSRKNSNKKTGAPRRSPTAARGECEPNSASLRSQSEQ